MNMQQIISQARQGRPEVAAVNAGAFGGRLRLAAYLSRFPHASGVRFSARELVRIALRAQRCVRNGRDTY